MAHDQNGLGDAVEGRLSFRRCVILHAVSQAKKGNLMATVWTDDETAEGAQCEWHRPTLTTSVIEEITLGKLGSQFDGPAQPASFDGE
ncbi:MAG: hypothetical protein P0Y59_01470 [Candidatus Sphingomonas phytovorans]|nr:hypothetical protein [Sphingomonas sp.]WEK00394.1 MAG: hypothetical protein P0Y59_01470 [Sphingomonas sp.]